MKHKEIWSVDLLSNLSSSIDYGHTASATLANTEIKFLRITDIQDGFVNWKSVPFCVCSERERKRYELANGDIVFARTGATTGKSYLINDCPPKSVFASYLIRVRPNKRINPKYLFQYFQTSGYWRQISSRSTGTAQAGVNASKLASLQIPLPPLPEQKRIAEVLDKAVALREKRRLALQKLDMLLQSVFLEMFGDPVKNPKGWGKVLFDDVCKTRLGKMLDEKKRTGKNLRPYLRNANVQWNRFDLSSVFEMDFDERERETLKLEYGDLLICEGGEVGRAAIWRNDLPECYYQKALHKGRPNPEKTTPEFLMFLLWFFSKNNGFKDYVTSVTIAHLTGEKLKTIKIPLPPIELQRKFSELVKKIEDLKSEAIKSAEKLDSLFQSLQQRAFKGELFSDESLRVNPQEEKVWRQTSLS